MRMPNTQEQILQAVNDLTAKVDTLATKVDSLTVKTDNVSAELQQVRQLASDTQLAVLNSREPFIP